MSLEQSTGSAGEAIASAERTSDHVHVGRQPIYDSAGGVYGYELLFRDATSGSGDSAGSGESPAAADPRRMASQVLVSTFLEIGVEQLVGDRPAFLDVPKSFLTGTLPLTVPPERVVLQLDQSIDWDSSLLEVVTGLTQRGYRIALADFSFGAWAERLLDLASYVKLNIGMAPVAELSGFTARIRHHGARPTATGIGDAALLTAAYQAGFELFQGYVFARPQLVGGPGLSPSRISCVRMLGALLGEDVDLDELEDVIRTDPALAYRVLRLANSAGSGVRQQVSNVRQALVLIGPDQLRGWLVLMALADMGVSDSERLGWVLTRARMCELLAEHVQGARTDQAFLAGLLSALVSLLDSDPAAILSQVGASDSLADAVRFGTGPLGQVVACAVGYEDGGDCPGGIGEDGAPTGAEGVNIVTARRAYLSAVAWSLQLCTQTASHR